MSLLQVTDIECRYRNQPVIDGVSLHIQPGGFVSLLGPSGCGKTTILRAIAGFEPIHRGEIVLNGNPISRPGFTRPPEQRQIGMMFQDYTLFPHLTVSENIGFGMRDRTRAERRRDADALLEVVGLRDYGARYPHELSGGQQQRIALARAIAPGPKLLLMDEPFSSLDTDLRERLSIEVRQILRDRDITGLLVTHDQQEAFVGSDFVGVMAEGSIVQWDTPYNLYHEPANRFVADFIGQGAFLNGTIKTPDTIDTAIGTLQGNRAYPWSTGTPIEVLVRPDDVVADPTGPLSGIIAQKAFKGAETLYTVRLAGGIELLSLLPSHQDYRVGDAIQIRLDTDHLVLFRANR